MGINTMTGADAERLGPPVFHSFNFHSFIGRMGMTYPIFQAPVGSGCARPELAAAVAAAGGMGALSHYRTTPEAAAAEVRQVRSATDGPFQVNFVLIFPPRALTQVLEAGAPAITFSFGDPAPYVDEVRAAGAALGIQVTNAMGARRALALGADFLVCQGLEAGGHVQSTTPLWEVLPRVVAEAGDVAVIASGGIGDGAGIAKALSLGAAGAMLGTRFVATRESPAHPLYKESLVKAGPADTALTVCFDRGWPQAAHRVVRNSTLENWEAAGSPIAGRRPGENDTIAYRADGQPILRYADTVPRADTTGEVLDMCLYGGTSCEAIHDVPQVSELIHRLWSECVAARQ